MQINYVREDEDEPLDDTFAVEVLPSWICEDASAPAAVGTDSEIGPCRLRLLYLAVRRQGDGNRKSSKFMGENRLKRPPVPLQIYVPIGK